MLSFNKTRLKKVDALKQLQNQINLLVSDLELYKLKKDASQKFIFFKEQQIKVLKSVHESFDEYSDNMEMIFTDNQKEFLKIKNENFKLIGICLLHGISDINTYLRMKKEHLIHLVKGAYKFNWRQTPFELLYAEPTTEREITMNDIKEAYKNGSNKIRDLFESNKKTESTPIKVESPVVGYELLLNKSKEY